jgi:3',5'-cyclic AMP phosphodiesterase CpdA
MKTKKKVVIISILISLIIISSITISNVQLVDRVFYRMGFQEQICFPIIDEEFQSNNVTNVAVAGDFGINENSIKTLKNIQSSDPEVILITGDLGQSTAKEWIELSEFMDKDKMHIVLGDSDLVERNDYLKYSGLNDDYYSFDYQNIHFLAISTNEEKDNEFGIMSDPMQLDFIRSDLSNAADDPRTDWLVVFLHHPMYTSMPNLYSMDLRNLLQPTFDLYGVDLVINGHKHAYERTNPVTFNDVITDNESCLYDDPNGQIYLTVGTGGHSHSQFKQKEPWSIIQNHNDYGFLNIKLLNDGKTLYGEFVSNTGKVMDAFQINLNDNSNKNLGDEN